MGENATRLPMQNFNSLPRQRLVVVASVVLLHALALWTLQAGLLQRVLQGLPEMVVPVAVLVPEPSKPVPVVARVPVKPAVPHVKQTAQPPLNAPPVPAVQTNSPAPAPQPLAVADATATANAPTGVAVAQQPVAAPLAAAPTAPKVDLPSSDADYLHNPQPVYPAASERRREYGRVLLAVVVDAEGHAKSVSVKISSGFERLDQAALKAVTGWSFVPGKRNGVPTEMAVEVPIRFKPPE